MKWTEAQQKAIDFRNGNLLVSAAAGSGKTAVMIARVLDMLEKGETSLDRILVVTYTNAASASMRQKIAKKLDETENPVLRSQRAFLDRANISTIHAFCMQLLRKYYFALPLPPDFSIADNTRLNIFKKKAVNDALEGAAVLFENGEWPEYENTVKQFSDGRTDNSLENTVILLYEFLQSMPHPNEFTGIIDDIYRCNSVDESAWALDMLSQIKVSAGAYSDLISSFISTSLEPKAIDLLGVLNTILQGIINADTLSALAKLVTSVTFPRMTATCVNQDARSLFYYVISFIKSLKSLLENVDFSLSSLTLLHTHINVLLRLSLCYGEILSALLIKNKLATYDQILHYTVDLLEDESIRSDLQNSFDYIFIDEYQDSNALQEHILARISNDNNMFFVGDVKQSIYSFQLALPQLFIRKMRLYNGTLGVRIDLNNNFRSSAELLCAINELFSTTMHERTAGIEYDSAAALRPGENTWQNTAQTELCKTEFAANECVICEFSARPKLSECALAEGTAIVSKIKEMLGTPIYDAEIGTTRSITVNDIAILARSPKKYKNQFEELFKQAGIPFSCQSSQSVSSQKNTVALSLLRLILSRTNDFDLITVAASAIGGFSSKELSLIRLSAPEQSYSNAFFEYKDGELGEKTLQFKNRLDRWLTLSRALNLPGFLRRLFDESGLNTYFAANKPDADELEKLIETSISYSNTVGGSFLGFVRYCEAMFENNSAPSSDFSGEENDTVRMLTIHKSKGLEFPIVFICGCALPLFNHNDKSPLITDTDLGAAVRLSVPDEYGIISTFVPVAYSAVEFNNNVLASQEELRLLYVAMTRAKNKLILCGSIYRTSDEKFNSYHKYSLIPSETLALSFKSYFDLLLPILCRHRDGAALRNVLGAFCDTTEKNSRWKFSIIAAETQVLPPPIITHPEFEEADVCAYIQKAEAAFSWKYPHEAALSQRSKQTPSNHGTKQLLAEPTFTPLAPEGAKRGSIVHFVMEHIDLAAVREAINNNCSLSETIANELEKLKQLSDEEITAVPIAQIADFFASPLGKAMAFSQKCCRERAFCLLRKNEETNEDTLVQGVIDCYFYNSNGEIVIIDYKTDKIRSSVNELVELYAPQISLYKQALATFYPTRTIKAALYFFSANTAVEI